ncbi:hypothetical protein HF086_002059 [Spodoptera exigua]|uniref:Angiotensin-converting enzyme n=1 Tax=Spodoptera exigua TaxID=7107 RepID=A0A922MLB4_SPOEX|nr:hypothetical protein HF086_002059 [Spodoptera exigua]
MMIYIQLTCLLIIASSSLAVRFRLNPTSDMSADEKLQRGNKTLDQSDESGHEVDTDIDEVKEKKFLDDAMKTVLDPNTLIVKANDIVETFKYQLDELDKGNASLDVFMDEMDKLSLDVCKTSQDALWSYVTDINNETKKNKMQREEIDTMQRIWSRVTVCAYNSSCGSEDSVRTMSDVISIFKTSNDTKELAYYWKAYRDTTGKKIRPIFKDYVVRMNRVAESENFTDAGDMWRFAFEDDNFVNTVDRIWKEIKPFYDLLHDYVRGKLKLAYRDVFRSNDKLIPAHILGNLWAQEWQAVYPKVVAYSDYMRPKLPANETIHSKDLFDAVDDFHQSLGFESAKNSYQDVKETMTTANCLPSSHDMCDGVNYKKIGRILRILDIVAFHDAISDIVAVQLTSPEHLKTLNLVKVDTGPEVTLNHLLWMALEKFPLMAYAYVLDKWRWDVFGNSSLEHWNQHWWDLRYLISHVLEFQILLSLCKKANHTGPLHECSIYGVKEAGKLLSDGMALGASEDWRTVLQAITGETELSTEGILQYFAALQKFLKEENVKLAALNGDMDQSAPIIVGAIVVLLTILIIVLYCVKKHDFGSKVFSTCGLSKNGSLDIVTNELPQGKTNEVDGISEDKV